MEKLRVDNLNINKEKKLPSNLEAEQALIGSVLVNNDIIDEISNIVNRNEFYDPVHVKIYSLIENLHNKGMIANPITLISGTNIGIATVSNVNGALQDDNPADDVMTTQVIAITPAENKLVIGEELLM